MAKNTLKIFALTIGCIAVFILLKFVILKEKEPLQIGFVAGLSGKFADLGIDCRRGVELALNKINTEGGVQGRPLTLLTADDKQNPDEARKIIKSFIDQEVPVIIGHVTSSMTMASLTLINSSNSLLVSPTSSTQLLRDLDDNMVRVCAISTDAAIMMAKYLTQEHNIKHVVVIYDTSNKAYTEQWVKHFQTTFLERGGQSVFPITFESEPDLQMLPLVELAKSHNPEALVIVTNSVDGALICQQVRKTGWGVKLALSDWAATEQLINLGGESVEGAVMSQFFNRSSTHPKYLEFKEEFLKTYKTEPGFGAQLSYNATMMIATAMENQRKDEPLKAAILRISDFEGLQGDFSINRFGDSSNPTFIGTIKNGNFVIFEDFR